jgi:hypothetical protein
MVANSAQNKVVAEVESPARSGAEKTTRQEEQSPALDQTTTVAEVVRARPELTPQELLAALDFEIAQRDGAANRYGFSLWGILAALLGLLWASILEVSERTHNWHSVAVAWFAAWWFLNLVMPVFTKRLNPGPGLSIHGRDRRTLKQDLRVAGTDPAMFGYLLIELGLLIFVAAYLGNHGFPLMGWSAFGFSTLVSAVILVLWVVTIVKIPIIKNKRPRPLSIWDRVASIFFWAAYFGFFISSVHGVVTIWPGLLKEDLRLGCLLAGLVAGTSAALRLAHPPAGLAELRSLRSRLGLGLINAHEARAETEFILAGPSSESYFRSKGESLISCFQAQRDICFDLVARFDRLTAFANGLSNDPANQKLLTEAAWQNKGAYLALKSGLKELEALNSDAKRLRSELSLRIKIAKYIVDSPLAEIEAIEQRVERAKVGAHAAQVDLGNKAESAEGAKFIINATKNLPKNKQLVTLAEIRAALFSE